MPRRNLRATWLALRPMRVSPAFFEVIPPREGTSANPRVILELEASVMDNPVVAVVLGSSLADHTREMRDEELRKFKEEYYVSMERHEKEMAEMRRKEALSKTLVIDEFKSLDEYKEVVEGAASSYFGEGFDLCKNQIGTLYPNLVSKISRSIPT
ncbi:hypothetical protein Acr_00g0082790 [Actinidia rufa]|uniref:Uncharacterized protein n=1 Tax=Actinidia rufa TaxID=165716 RepID=A0A7J0DUQ8_9ERIC|nr:hypothetical protein Acr_00g0082790 [Actinidia rufa]